MTDEEKEKLMLSYNVWEEDENGNKKLRQQNLAELIYQELNYHFITTLDGEIFTYNGGYYEPKGEQKIKNITEEFLGEYTTEHNKKEIVGYIRDKNYKKREIFDSNPDLLNLMNGVYNIKTGELIPHTHEQHFLSQLPITYNKDSQIITIKKFFEEVLRTEDMPLLQEIFGYTLLRKHPIQKAFMFIGDGANGKSVTLSLLKTFLGKDNTCAVSLQDLVKFRFSVSSLYGKMANIYPDVTDEALHKTGMFKILTGGDMVTAEQKFKDPFNFDNYAKLLFSANKIPEVHDDTDAFFRRWIFITFPNKFEADKADKKLLEKLTTSDEISGLFNWAIEGLKRLQISDEFTNTKTTDEMRESYQRLSSPIKAFVDDCLEIDVNGYLTKDELYTAFCTYCKNGNLPIMAKNVFSMRLHEYVQVIDYRPDEHGKRTTAWRGIRFKENISVEKSVNAVNAVNSFTVPKLENYEGV
jgi:putative DNA primase/helicase